MSKGHTKANAAVAGHLNFTGICVSTQSNVAAPSRGNRRERQPRHTTFAKQKRQKRPRQRPNPIRLAASVGEAEGRLSGENPAAAFCCCCRHGGLHIRHRGKGAAGLARVNLRAASAGTSSANQCPSLGTLEGHQAHCFASLPLSHGENVILPCCVGALAALYMIRHDIVAL